MGKHGVESAYASGGSVCEEGYREREVDEEVGVRGHAKGKEGVERARGERVRCVGPMARV